MEQDRAEDLRWLRTASNMGFISSAFWCCAVPLLVAPFLTWLWAQPAAEWDYLSEGSHFIVHEPQQLNCSALLSRELMVLKGDSNIPQNLQARGERALNHTILVTMMHAFESMGRPYLRSMRRRVSRLPHRSAIVEDSAGGSNRLHFVHIQQEARSTSKCSASNSCKTVAILLVHGWPGSFMEFFGSGEAAVWSDSPPLTGSGPHSASSVPDIGGFTQALLRQEYLQHVNVHLVVPSLPGYGFSEALPSGQSAVNIARSLVALMHKLGYGAGGTHGSDGYFTQGGDWGGIIASLMARLDPLSTRGMHNNMAVPGIHASSLAGLALAAVTPSRVLHAEDEQRLRAAGVLPGTAAHLLRLAYSTGYMHEQVTQPDTLATAVLGHGGSDGSAAVVNGVAAWMLEKFDGWSDCGWFQSLPGAQGDTQPGSHARDLLQCLGGIRIMDAIALYVSTGSFRSSLWVYADTAADGEFWAMMGSPLSRNVPVGVADMPGEVLLRFPLPALQRTFPGLSHFTRMPYGGHFAAWETPGALAKDVAHFVQAVVGGAAEPMSVKGGAAAPQEQQGDEEL